jgi:hypothetical protein
MGLTPEEQAALAQAPRQPPGQQWWNLPAKIALGRRIAGDESARALVADWPRPPHNDTADAMRHARWSQRMATEIGPIFSGIAGLEHEGENIAGAVGGLPGRLWNQATSFANNPGHPAERPYDSPANPSVLQTLSESGMDLRNNAEGISAALSGRPIEPTHLQTRPVIPGYR